MKRAGNSRQVLIWGAAMLAALGFTVGVFLTFAPDAPRYSYWIAMADMSLMVIVTGTYLIYNLLLSTKKTTSRLPIAMHIGIVSTVGLFFAASAVIVAAFLVAFNHSSLDRVFLWVVIGKWVLLILAIVPMWSTGQEGEEEKVIQARSGEQRGAVLNRVQGALLELRRLPTQGEEGGLQRQVVDELERLRNQLRSRISARTALNQESWHLDNALDELGAAIGSLDGTPEAERKGVLLRIRECVRKMSQAVDDLSGTRKE